MRIAVYTLTRDRLEYTKTCFASLREKAGHPFDHYVWDNGSEDGTAIWLKENEGQFAKVVLSAKNRGISYPSNMIRNFINLGPSGPYDLIIKMDNDCLVQTDGILAEIVRIYEQAKMPAWVLSPRVEGINRQPTRERIITVGEVEIGAVAVVGGLFHVVPAFLYGKYQYPLDLPLAKGQDEHFCDWVRHGGHTFEKEAEVGYIENLLVQHYEGTDAQAKRYPDYFQRKWKEETEKPEVKGEK